MSTLELQDRLERAAEALPDPTPVTLGEVRARARSRRRRRGTLMAAASLSLVMVAGVVGWGVLPEGPRSPVIEPVGQGPHRAVELADDAVWKSPPVDDATAAVKVFSELLLGWDDPTIELDTDDETGPVWVTIAAGQDTDRQVRALFTPTPAAGVWQVVQVGDGLGSTGPDPRILDLVPSAPPSAAGADLFVRYAGQTWHVSLDDDELRDGRVDLSAYGLPPGGQRNAGLIVYRDGSGETLTAAGGHSGTGDQPAAPSSNLGVLREIAPLEFGDVIVACMAEFGFAASSVDGGEGVSFEPVPPHRNQALETAYDECRARYPTAEIYTRPLTREQLGILYDYWIEERFPCLEAQGISGIEPPSRERFVSSADYGRWSPEDVVARSAGSGERLDELLVLCPRRPPLDRLYGEEASPDR